MISTCSMIDNFTLLQIGNENIKFNLINKKTRFNATHLNSIS